MSRPVLGVFLCVGVFLFDFCNGIYTPSDGSQNSNIVSAGVKTSSPSKFVQFHHNYSKVYVHNDPAKISQNIKKTIYIASESGDGTSQKYFPVYNGHTYGQRPETLKVQSVQVYNRLNNTREENIRSLQDTLEKLEQPNNKVKILTSQKQKKEISKQIEVYSKCPPGVTGQFVYDLSCHQFLNCWKGRGIVQNCAPGTLFNPKTLECDFPNKVECITGARQNTLNIRQASAQLTEQAKCPENFIGLIPNYTDCSKFVSCNYGSQIPMDCPPGTLFDVTKNICDHAHLSICYNGKSQSQSYQYAGQNQNQGHHRTEYGREYTGNQGQNNYNQYSQNTFQTSYGTNKQTGINSNLDFGASQSNYQTHGQYQQGQVYNNNNKYYQSGTHHTGVSTNNNKYYQSGNPQSSPNQHQHGTTDCDQSTGGCSGTNNNQNQYYSNKNKYYQTGNQQSSNNQNHHGIANCDQSTGRCTGNINNQNQYSGNNNKYYQTGNPQSLHNQNQHGTANCDQSTGGCSGTNTNQNHYYDNNNKYYQTGNTHSSHNQNQHGTANCDQSTGGCSGSYNHQTQYSNSNGAHQTGGSGASNADGGNYHQINQGSGQNHYSSSGPNYHTVCNINDPNCKKSGSRSAVSCSNGASGLEKHPFDCKKFLNCANGQTFIQDCGPGTVFNPNSKVCDFPYNVDCGDSANTEAYGYETTTSGYGYGNGYGQYETGYGNKANTNQGSIQGSGGTTTQQNGYNWNKPTNNQGGTNQGTGINQQNNHGSNWNKPNSNQGATGTNQQNNCNGGRCINPNLNWDQTTDDTINIGYGTNNNRQEKQGSYGHQQKCVGTSCSPSNISPNLNWGQRTPDVQFVYGSNKIDSARPVNNCPNGNCQTTPRVTIFTNQRGTTTRPTLVSENYEQIEQTYQKPVDYDDMFDLNYKPKATTARNVVLKSWPPAFPEPEPSTDVNADYVFDNDLDYGELEIGEVYDHKPKKDTKCDKDDFHCTFNTCVSKTSICDGIRDCQNGKDELDCKTYLDKFKHYKNSKLAVVEKQRWNNVTFNTCAVLCLESVKFDCRSFNYRRIDKTCFLSDSNIGLSGMLLNYNVCDYYEHKSQTIDCRNLHVCANNKCISSAQICDGFDDCGDRMDERNCKANDLGYEIKLAGTNQNHKGRIEVKAFGKIGYICDDKFGLREANVVCKELGFNLGAAELKGNSYYAQDISQNNTFYLMDDVDCFGNETSIKDCNFSGWGVHNCMDGEIAGLKCKVSQEQCPNDHWQCNSGNECIPFGFVCDGLFDCSDNSDEADEHCEAPNELRLLGPLPNEGRVEIKHHGVWGTICDDDFNEDAAKVICRQFGYRGSSAVKKDAFYGQGSGPIWLDQVYCYGNETNLENCTHWNWGEHNCDHSEDVGVVCSNVDIIEKSSRDLVPSTERSYPIYPNTCGYRKDNQFLLNDDVHFRVVKGSIAKKGDYPWQAAIKIKTNNKPAHWCGAIIISEKFVLTAAHCLVGYSKGAYMVVAGDYNVDEDEGTEQTDFVEEFFLHEQFRKGHKMNNDIALIKLKRGFRLNQDVQPLCLPDDDTVYGANMNCTISGFGSTESGVSAFSHNLRAGWVPIQTDEVCKMPHVYGTNLMDGMFCAGFLEEGVDACDGDSGGPLACLKDGVFTLFGITSWGQHCGYANKPGVYVKVAYYRKWIDNILQQHS